MLRKTFWVVQGGPGSFLGHPGGVGLAAIQLSKIQGLKVIAAASTDNKLNICNDSIYLTLRII